MVEAFMFAGLGFLAASLLALVTVPFVHDRAERLTMRRIDGSVPLSVGEMQAEKDHLRADFAMSTRRLELTIEQLRAKTASQASELGKKKAAINRLKVELDSRAATILALKKRGMLFHKIGEEPSVKADWLREAECTLSEKDAEIAKLDAELDERSRTADSQRIEIAALQIQVDTLKDQVGHPRKNGNQDRLPAGPERLRTIMRRALSVASARTGAM